MGTGMRDGNAVSGRGVRSVNGGAGVLEPAPLLLQVNTPTRTAEGSAGGRGTGQPASLGSPVSLGQLSFSRPLLGEKKKALMAF